MVIVVAANDGPTQPPTTTTRILVTGASGELGGALARAYARPGAHLSLWGRDPERLAAIGATCLAAGAKVDTRSLDIADVPAALEAARAEDAAAPFDIALLVAGLGETRGAGDLVESAELVRRLGTVNFTAPAAIGAALTERMATRRRGALVFIGSAAAFHALPFAAAYSGTKAGLARFAQALRLSLRPHGVSVTLVSPGFIDPAELHQNGKARPLALQPDHVAARIVRAVERRQAHLILPWPFALLRLFDRLLPAPLRDRLLLSLTPPA
ncbi:SDR family oxidoreductase [Novosphingobium sp. 9U]|uniref:SDR family NAD(P)-dependent oxidoreductase n=1 Tax=Novosphingobium sp. 9U TaxID=2653158 RepID=UPI0012F1E48F|nr:SDR family NAD(P)-dependent oxidoreductase [Novosphingobium sp. 9U]VWX53854.1 Oxidoreductase [Novosphingobium sp. 9U]